MTTRYHPVFNFFHSDENQKRNHIFLSHYLSEMEKATATDNFKKKLFSLLPDRIVFYLFGASADILFFTHRFPDLLEAKTTYRFKILSPFSFATLFNKDPRLSYFPIYFFARKLFYFYQNDPLLESPKAKQFVAKTIRWLQSSSIRYLAVSNDWLFVERFLIFCAKQLNIPSICLQEGLISPSNFTQADTKYADFLFAWDKHQASLHKIRGYSDREIKILGYPHNVSNASSVPTKSSITKKRLCILGQPFENFDPALGSRKKELFTRLIELTKNTFESIVYKPHPGEQMAFLPKNIDHFRGPLKKAIEEYDVFISLSSTSLLEATVADKIAIQIYDEAFNPDNMEKAGYAYTIKSDQMEKIMDFIATIETSFLPVCNVPRHKDIAEKFLEYLKELGSD